MKKKYDWLVWKLTNVSVESEEDGDTKSRVFINGIDAVMPNSDSFYDCKGEYRRFGEDLSVGLKCISDDGWEYVDSTEEGFIFRRLEKLRRPHTSEHEWIESREEAALKASREKPIRKARKEAGIKSRRERLDDARWEE